MSDSRWQLEQRHECRCVQLEPQQSAFQFQLEHRGPFRFTPTKHIMCGDTTLDMGAVIHGSQSVCGSKGACFRSGQHDRKKSVLPWKRKRYTRRGGIEGRNAK
nr:MAG TPA: hypothetical protein [Caudoviricetes sp.]